MSIPTATYRIQFRNGMTFYRAVKLVPYLQQLGISHLYASPIFAATGGSTHGYDITDANKIGAQIGGRASFDRLAAALKQASIGLILDIVPTHMAASLEKGELIAALSHALIDDNQINMLHLAYEAVTGQRNDVATGRRAARELMVDRNFAGKFTRLLAIATNVAQLEHRNFGEAELHVALRELLIAFPVYRTYGQSAGMLLAGK